MLSASSSNNHSLFSFGRHGGSGDAGDDTTTASFDFLPSVSFDDLQSSLETASSEFKLTQFPTPTGERPIFDDSSLLDKMAGQQSNFRQNGNTSRVVPQPNPTPNTAAVGGRPIRTASLLRKPSNSSRQPSAGSAPSGAPNSSVSIADAPTAPAAMRNRRQSHYPPVSTANTIAKPSRKSAGPGLLDSDFGTQTARKRRPSLISSGEGKDNGPRTSLEIFSGYGGDAKNAPSSRATKTRSIQGAPRLSTSNFSSSTGSSGSQLTPDGNRKSVLFPRSPRAGAPTTPGSGRRASVMPTHSSHVSGLGARTISPTDAQRMKRMSMHQPQSLSSVASTLPPSSEPRPSSRSPSMIPRKTSTPSSQRTTPDPNRKSYSSGLSATSNASFNTQRTSVGSIQRGVNAPNLTNSRLPAPKAVASLSNTAPAADEEEDVPPVPAIPKAYESPKDSPAEVAFMEKKKANYAFDASSINSTSTGTLSNAPSFEPLSQVQRKPSTRKIRGTMGGATSDGEKKTSAPAQPKKNLAPLRLPPLNLGPLSTPTAAKIASYNKDASNDDGKHSPPPNRIIAKTPTTPMTASKSSFFSRGHKDRDPEKPTARSSTAVNHNRLDSPSAGVLNSSPDSIPDLPVDTPSQKPAISPFLSTSLPKNESTFGANLAKVKTNGSINTVLAPPEPIIPAEPRPQQKPSGPRAPKLAKSSTKSPVPSPDEPQEPPTPSSMSTLRRKLSLSWKRSASKSSSHQAHGSVDNGKDHARQESMPPPRIPISATLGSMKAPSPNHAVKPSTSYLESRRRKSSASSLTAVMAQEKEQKGAVANVKKNSLEVGNSSMIENTTTTSRTPSMARLLRPRPSTVSVKPETYIADVDKDDLLADEEMKKIASKRRETELAARTLDALRKRATPKERVGPQEAIRIAMLNIYERGEIIDYKDIYFCGTQNAAKVKGDVSSSAPNFGYDDERGDYSIVVGDHLSYRYEIVDVLGKGSFGQVVRCIDHKTGVLVAVKIIRNKKRFHQQALVEVNILQKIREWDPKNKHSMVNFTHSFYFRGHLCISTELLDMNLYEFIKLNNFRGSSLKLVRRFTKQMLSCLTLLKQHKVIHCDLKPENILLRHPMHSELKVIDFGSSCFENEKVYTYIQSRFYRSPEVILGMTYGLPIDMWSVGCILAELYTGVPIFPGENEQEQLACIMEVFGPPEKHLIEKSTRKKLFFDSMGKPRLTVSSKGRRRRPSSKTLQQVLKCDDEPFLDFLSKCLRWDPDRRIKPEEAVRHEFITGLKPGSSMARVATATRDASPMKRHNTISAPRPLPDPPAAGNRIVPRMGPSPHKPVVAATARRASGITGPFTSGGIKRTSTGQSGLSQSSAPGSNLPRVAGRSVSAKQDLASAGATAAMNRRV
jgi:dual specificity tyrosine-phosphorylation-regulated kinase 2/3/4